MEVEFTLEEEDVVAFQEHVWKHPPPQARRGLRSLWVFIVFFALLSLLSLTSLFRGQLTPRAFIAPGVLTLLVFLQLTWRLRAVRQLRRGLRQGQFGKILGWHRLTLTPEGLVHTTEYSSIVLAWKAVHRIVVDGPYAFFFDNPSMARILPERAFPSYEAFWDFVQTARRFHQAASEAEPSGA